MKQTLRIFALFWAIFVIPFPFFAWGTLNIDVTQGTIKPFILAAPTFVDGGNGVGANITQVIAADLQRSGSFNLVDPAAYIQSAAEVLAGPRFNDWKILNTEVLLTGRVLDEGGNLKVEFYVFDVLSQTLLLQSSFVSTPENWRRIAHKIADEVYQRLTGESGYFDTRIVYVAQHGSRLKKKRRLAIMDQDGANHQYLTDGQHMVLTPRFSPTTHEIAYLSFNTRPASIHLMDLQTGQQQVIGQFKGMITFAPRFSPDGNALVMSHSNNGKTTLSLFHLASRSIQTLTQSSGAIDTSATYSPDGSQLVFNSDRGGTPQLYVMSASGGEPQRISFGEGRYYTPVWSPRGDWIVFIKSYKGAYNLGVMRSDGSGERVIAQNYLLESPTWSPNGRFIMFSGQASLDSPFKLYTIDVTGYNLRELPTPEEGTHPAWSPLIPG